MTCMQVTCQRLLISTSCGGVFRTLENENHIKCNSKMLIAAPRFLYHLSACLSRARGGWEGHWFTECPKLVNTLFATLKCEQKFAMSNYFEFKNIRFPCALSVTFYSKVNPSTNRGIGYYSCPRSGALCMNSIPLPLNLAT
jgi:hypothetical protein